jgi:catechol 2,3-dioxygenase-like lactoylglutathione lyase family enzyme
MSVKRVVSNLATEDMEAARRFYGDLLGMATAMDQGWIITLIGAGEARPQISFASEGGSGTPVPDLSIEVDDFHDLLEKLLAAGHQPEYGPVCEPWGVERFYVRDPFGRLLNILRHDG